MFCFVPPRNIFYERPRYRRRKITVKIRDKFWESERVKNDKKYSGELYQISVRELPNFIEMKSGSARDVKQVKFKRKWPLHKLHQVRQIEDGRGRLSKTNGRFGPKVTSN